MDYGAINSASLGKRRRPEVLVRLALDLEKVSQLILAPPPHLAHGVAALPLGLVEERIVVFVVAERRDPARPGHRGRRG